MTSRPPRPTRPVPRALAAHRARRRVRALVWKARFLLAAGALGLAAALTVAQLQPRPPDQATIVVAARAVPAGVPLAAGDLRTVQVPPQAAPPDVLHELAAALDRVLVVPVSEGTVLSEPVLVAPGGGPHGPPGTVVAAVRLGDPALAQILGPGMYVDLLAPSPSSGSITSEEVPAADAVAALHLARRALVLPGPSVTTPPSGGLALAPAPDEATDLILVAVTPEEASLLANAGGWGVITAVVVP